MEKNNIVTFKRAKVSCSRAVSECRWHLYGIQDRLSPADGSKKAFLEDDLDAARGLLQAVVQSDFIDPYIPVSTAQSEMVENMDLEQYYGFVFNLKDDEEEKA